ncbi:ABC transporter permease [uncultured Ramlibacter sp.]|uniref:ABC transporter permease n=1 Tax=uncultured Ramlibacter sp. TaxID=260755 RepID=UPI002607BB00|nr:ABC transporter permease [uncultured Ramlibacter sp.]
MPQFLNRHASLASFIAVLALWELACRTLAIPVFVLPAPSLIATAAADMGLVRWGEHLAATLQVAVIGYLAAIAIALPLAVALTSSPLLARTVMPWLVVVQSTPIVAIAPIIVVALGAGNLPRVVITTLIAFFPMVISTATGLAAVPAELIELSRSLRAPRSREYTQIRLPYAVPYIFAALKVSITLAVIGAVVAEFVAAEKGLGYLILFATSSFKVPLAFASLAILVCSSLLLYGLIVWLHRRLFPWSL